MRISDWSSDVCSSDLCRRDRGGGLSLQPSRGAYCRSGRPSRSPIGRGACGLCRADARLRGQRRRSDRALQGTDRGLHGPARGAFRERSEEHTSELQSLMRISYAVFCLKKKKKLTKKTSYKET